MTADELRAAINEAFDEVERWFDAEMSQIPQYGDCIRTEDVDRLRSEYAARLERQAEPFLALAERDDPAFARELREQNRQFLETLRRPSKPTSWLH